MKSWLFLGASLVLGVLILQAAGVPSRYIKEGVFISEGEPALHLRVNERYSYVGNIDFVLKNIARCERHYWVDAAPDKTIRSLIVLQFEGFLDGVQEKYRFSIPTEDFAGANYRFTQKPVRIGTHDFVHNTWAFDHTVDARENPGAESARTIAFLSAKGYKLDNELIMSRFVRAVGEEARSEFIIFYMEPLRVHGHSIADFPDGGPVSAAFDRLSSQITEDSLSAIKILSDD